MKKIVLRYGVYAGLAELLIFIGIYIVIALFNPSHEVQGYIGWVNLLCPLLFVYFGIRYYRDKENNGALGFLEAIKIGLLIVIIPAIAFGIVETVFVTWIEPDFYKQIARHDLEAYRKTLPPAEFAIKAKQLEANTKAYQNPLTNFIFTALMIAALGIFATLISAVLLFKREKSLVAAN